MGRPAGLCSYVVHTTSGEYLYRSDCSATGRNRADAVAFLWWPEDVPDHAAALRARVPWMGPLVATRLR
jgi:hypothetical protein